MEARWPGDWCGPLKLYEISRGAQLTIFSQCVTRQHRRLLLPELRLFGLLLNSIAKFEIRCFLASDPGAETAVIPGEHKEQSNTYKLDGG